MQSVMLKILTQLKHYLDENPQTILITGIDLNNGEDITQPLTKFLRNASSDLYSTEDLICRPFIIPTTLQEAISVFSSLFKLVIPELKEEGHNNRTTLVSIVCKTILLLRQVIFVRYVPDIQKERFLALVDKFSQTLIEIVWHKLNSQPIEEKYRELSVCLQNVRSAFGEL